MSERYDEQSIKYMAKLAVYDQNDSERDERKLSVFRHDYIYKKNARVRFWVFIGSFIILALYVMKLIAVDGINPAELVNEEYRRTLVEFTIRFIIVEVVYTAIGTLIFTVDYQRARKRSEDYLDTMSKLERRRNKLAAKARNAAAFIKAAGDVEEFADKDDLDAFWGQTPEFEEEEDEPPPDEKEEDDEGVLVYMPKRAANPAERRGIVKNDKYMMGRKDGDS